MTLVEPGSRLVDHDQPTIKDGLWIWPGSEGRKKKAAVGNFANSYCVVEGGSADGGAGVIADDSALGSLKKDQLMNGVRGGQPMQGKRRAMWALGLALLYCLV